MTAHLLTEMFNRVAVQNRNPTWAEFEKASPAEQRAIVARWQEIKTDNNADLQERALATGRLWQFRGGKPGRSTYDPHVETGEFVNDGRVRVSATDMIGE